MTKRIKMTICKLIIRLHRKMLILIKIINYSNQVLNKCSKNKKTSSLLERIKQIIIMTKLNKKYKMTFIRSMIIKKKKNK